MAEGGEGSSQGMRIEAIPDVTQMFQDMARQFITAITGFGGEAPRYVEQGCPFKIFERLSIPMFDGKLGPIEAENWLVEAKRWWNAKKVLLVQELGSERAISWERFQKEFL
jgi:hypothetical protein